ncbi:MAG: asparagine synthase (glutamine-hydrolyzing) [Planctomycetota bacterium]
MCGILGVVHRDPQLEINRERLLAARDTLTHRGPDEAGLWIAPGIGFGHRRLKVLDLTHGQQPMLDHDTEPNHALVYNGEVYNFRELRRELEQQGHSFQGDGDTEVLFHALNTQGPDAVNSFEGMFALGHWDHEHRRLLLVRDRLGQKPLYWHDDGNQLVFASELKALLRYLDRKFDIDPAALDEFFTRGYILSPRTIFRGIHKLPAGCRLRLSASDWTLQVDRYWDIEPQSADSIPTDADDAVELLDELLTDAVRKRMVSDVPLGCLLSGGIDSSLITAIASKISDQPITAFSIGFDESAEHNELPFAEMVAKHHDCRWISEMVRGGDSGGDSEGDFLADLDDALKYFDEPFGNFTVIAQRKLAQLCRQHLTVVLSGQGGDELTAGYPGRYNWVLDTPRDAPRHQHLPPVDDLNTYLGKTSFVGWNGGRAAMFSDELQHAVTNAHSPADGVAPFWRTGGDTLNHILYSDVKTNLPDYLVTIEERMTMSASLEARNPLLDQDVVNYLLSLPGEMKVRGGQNKWPLFKLCERYLPREAYDRPKRGFTPPLGLWLEQNKQRIAEHFRETAPLISGVFSPSWQAFLSSGQTSPQTTMPVYYSLVLSNWAEHYGDYINAWPSENAAKTTPSHAVYREQVPAAIGESRWFAQALGNFADGSAVHLVGDVDGHFAFIAEQLGYAVTDDATWPQRVVFGLNALDQLTATAFEQPADLVWVASFAGHEQPKIQQALQSLPAHLVVHGTQGVQIDTDRGVLIAKLHAKPSIATQTTPTFDFNRHVA